MSNQYSTVVKVLFKCKRCKEMCENFTKRPDIKKEYCVHCVRRMNNEQNQERRRISR